MQLTMLDLMESDDVPLWRLLAVVGHALFMWQVLALQSEAAGQATE